MKVLNIVVWGLLVLLSNTYTSAEDNTTVDSDLSTQQSTKPAPNRNETTQQQPSADDSKRPPTPIESFVPSEEVSPDRSISFPVDI